MSSFDLSAWDEDDMSDGPVDSSQDAQVTAQRKKIEEFFSTSDFPDIPESDSTMSSEDILKNAGNEPVFPSENAQPALFDVHSDISHLDESVDTPQDAHNGAFLRGNSSIHRNTRKIVRRASRGASSTPRLPLQNSQSVYQLDIPELPPLPSTSAPTPTLYQPENSDTSQPFETPF